MNLDFKNFMSLEQYKEIAEVEIEEKNKEKPDYDKIFKKNEIFEKSIVNYLKTRAEQDLLQMPTNSTTHYSNLLHSFKNLVENKLSEREEDKFHYMFSKVLMFNMSKMVRSEEKNIENGYEELVQKINKGDFDKYELECDAECFGCGERMKLVARNWEFKLVTLKLNDDHKIEMKLLPDCVENKLYEVSVEFKTGELLMADWFRIKEFSKEVEYDPDYNKLSINSDLGQIKSTEHAASLGFVTIHVGNSSPHIYQQGEDFIFGHETENGTTSEYKEKGYVCTDLWNVTVIDKSRLIEIVAKKVGEEKAIEKVEKYLKSEKGNINFINVQPGTYKIGFYPRKDASKFDSEIPKDIEAMFTMKKEAPKKKLKM